MHTQEAEETENDIKEIFTAELSVLEDRIKINLLADNRKS